MANIAKVHGEITGDAKGFQRAVNEARKAVRDLNKAINRGAGVTNGAAGAGERFFGALESGINSAKKINNTLMNTWNATRLVGQGMQTIGKAMTMFITIPIAGALFKGAQAAIQFDEALVRVQKTTELTSKGMAQLSAGLRSQARQTRTSHTELAKMAEQIGQAGIRGVPQILDLVEVFNMLTVATDLTAENVSKSITRMANAFNVDLTTDEGVEQIRKFSNVINALENQIATTAPEIVEGMFNFAQVGSSLMQNMGEQALVGGAALIATLTSVGFSAEEAGNGLRNLSLKMVQNQDVLFSILKTTEKYNTEAKLTAAMTENFGQVLTDLILVSGNSEEALSRVVAMFDLAGIRGGKAGATLASVWPQVVRNTKIANDEFERGTSLYVEYQRALLSTQGHLEVLRNNLNDLALTFGETLLPVINRVVEITIPAIRNLIEVFDGLSDQMKLMIVAGAALLAIAGPLTLFFGQLIFGASMIMIAFHRAIGVVLDLAGAFVWLGRGAFKILPHLKRLAANIALVFRGWVAFAAAHLGVTKSLGAVAGTLALVIDKLAALGAALGLGAFGAAVFAKAMVVAIVGAIALIITKITGFDEVIARVFENLARKAKLWGENLARTYASGFLGGAVKHITKAVVAVANLIARFFRAFSPPKEGPLSHIDKWGKTLIDTYLKGFLNADFSILSQVGGIIENVLGSLSALGKIGEKQEVLFAMQAREDLAELIKIFNETGNISKKVLDEITANLGEAADEVQELIKLWLEHNRIKEELAKLEKEREGVLDTYRQEIQLIAQSNMTAEEKADAIRKAMRGRDDELRNIKQQEDALEDELSLAEEKLEFQQNMIQAMQKQDQLQLRLLDKLDEMGKALSEMSFPDLGDLDGDPFEDAKEATNDLVEGLITLEDRINTVKGVWDAFVAGVKGEDFGFGEFAAGQVPEGTDPADVKFFQMEETAPGIVGIMAEANRIGQIFHDTWEKIDGVVGDVQTKVTDIKDTIFGAVGLLQGLSTEQMIDPSDAKFFEDTSIFEDVAGGFDTLAAAIRTFPKSSELEGLQALQAVYVEWLGKAGVPQRLNDVADSIGHFGETYGDLISTMGDLGLSIVRATTSFIEALASLFGIDIDLSGVVGFFAATRGFLDGLTVNVLLAVVEFFIELVDLSGQIVIKPLELLADVFNSLADDFETFADLDLNFLDIIAMFLEAVGNSPGVKALQSLAESLDPIFEALGKVPSWLMGGDQIPTRDFGAEGGGAKGPGLAMIVPDHESLPQKLMNWWNTSVVPKFTEIANSVGEKLGIVKDKWMEGWTMIKQGLIIAWVQIGIQVLKWLNTTKGYITDKVGDFKQAGKDIIQGLVDGVISKAEDFLTELSKLAEEAKSLWAIIWNLGSPSKFMEESSEFIIEGAVKGLVGNADSFLGAMNDVGLAATSLAASSPLTPMAASGGGMVIHVHDPVVREDRDIERIADEIERRLSKKAKGMFSSGRFGLE